MDFFFRDKRWRDGDIFLSRLWWLEASLPLTVWCCISWEPGQTHYPLRKPLHSVSSYSWALSCLSFCFFFFSPGSRHGSAFCSLAPCLFGLLVWDWLSWETLTVSRTVISLLFHSQPTACLRLPACLEQLSTHKGLKHTELFWSQSNRKSMEGGFIFSERGR